MSGAIRPTQSREAIIEGPRSSLIVGSDLRAEVVQPCGLCRTVKPLVLGHVTPKWAARWAKDEGGLLGVYNSRGVVTKRQDFIKSYLFCRECDQRLGDAERYLSTLTSGTTPALTSISVTASPSDGDVLLAGVDTTLVKRALAGIVLKAHLSPATLYSRNSLSRGETNELVKMIVSDVYPASRLAVEGYRLANTVIPDVNPRAQANIVQFRGFGGCLSHIVLAGWHFTVFLGPAARWIEDTAQVLGESAAWHLGMDTYWRTGMNEWIDENDDTLSSGDMVPDRPIEDQEDCPCGSGLPFADCCSGIWLPSDTSWKRPRLETISSRSGSPGTPAAGHGSDPASSTGL